jgi:drug/metabolite transporter (DMT)-like permease
MSKPLLGLILGIILGAIDGATAWFYPEARPMMMTFLIGSTVKGLVAGILIGFFARKVHSIPMGLLFGLGVGLVLGYLAAMNPTPDGQHNYVQIMIPGAVVGAILGLATQKYGTRPKSAAAQ